MKTDHQNKKKNFANVRGKIFQVWNKATKEDITTMLNEYHRGVIICCPICHQVDINPYKHFSECNPEFIYDRNIRNFPCGGLT